MKRKRKGGTPRYISELRGAKNPYFKMSELRLQLPTSSYPTLARWFPNLVSKQPQLVLGRFPHKPTEVRPTRFVMKPVSLEREMMWATSAERLGRFAGLRSDLDVLLLNGTYDDCSTKLQQIEDFMGHSLLSIELRMALIATWKGLEAQNAYTTELLESKASSFVRFFVSHMSQRNDAASDPFRFKNVFHSSIDQWNPPPDYRSYMLYKIGDEWEDTPWTISSILRLEAISSIIDYYETFVRLATRSIADDSPTASCFLAAVTQLSGTVSDSRLRRLSSIGVSIEQQISPNILPETTVDILDLFAEGKYRGAIEALQSVPASARDDLLLRLGSMCYAETSDPPMIDNTLFSRLLALCTRVIKKDAGVDGPFAELMRLSYNFRFASFSQGLQEFAKRQLSSSPLTEGRDVRRIFLSSRNFDVPAISCVPVDRQLKLAEHVERTFSRSVGVRAELARLDLPGASFIVPADQTDVLYQAEC